MSAAPDPVIGSDKKRLEDYAHYNQMDETLRNAASALSISADGSRAGSGNQTSHEGPNKYNPPIENDPDVTIHLSEIAKGYDEHEALEHGHPV